MTDEVKEFIEDNIILIDAGDWYSVFDNWFDMGPTDAFYTKQLLEVLLTSGVSFPQQTLKARENVIRDKASNFFSDWISDVAAKKTNDTVLNEFVITEDIIKNYLGLNYVRIDELVREAAKGFIEIIFDHDNRNYEVYV